MTPQLTGHDKISAQLESFLTWPKNFRHECDKLGVRWPNGLLLTGPPGVGKTSLVQTVSRKVGAQILSITSADLVGSQLGESEKRLRASFRAAHEVSKLSTAVIFIDEIDALCPQRARSHAHESRLVGQLLTLIDGVSSFNQDIRVIAATNQISAVDFALRRPGRFDWEITVPLPTELERLKLFQEQTKGFDLSDNVDLSHLSRVCTGYTGADIKALCRESLLMSMDDALHMVTRESLRKPGRTWQEQTVKAGHFVQSMNAVGPSIRRAPKDDASATVFEHLLGYEDVKDLLKQSIDWPMLHPRAFKRLGLKSPQGILLHGPPGCGKTSLANAACVSGQGAVKMSSSMLFSMHIGEGEALLQQAFHRARLAAPSMMIIDDIDAVFGARRQETDSKMAATLLSVLLTELDGLYSAKGVTIVATSSRPWNIDPALLRPGRFDKIIFVPKPDLASRLEILKLCTKPFVMQMELNLSLIAAQSQNFSCAELHLLSNEAVGVARRRRSASFEEFRLTMQDFDQAFSMVTPMCNSNDQWRYDHFHGAR